MDINDLTVGQLKEVASLYAGICGSDASNQSAAKAQLLQDEQPVIVCTDKRGVVFGYTTNTDARPIVLTKARMCLYWSAGVGGVFGLAETGPTKDCKISAVVPSISLEGVTAIMTVDPVSEKAWSAAKVQGR